MFDRRERERIERIKIKWNDNKEDEIELEIELSRLKEEDGQDKWRKGLSRLGRKENEMKKEKKKKSWKIYNCATLPAFDWNQRDFDSI